MEHTQSSLPAAAGYSRRATACLQCQKHKVRCVLSSPKKPPCQRCQTRNIPCLFKRDPAYPLSSSGNRLLDSLLSDLKAIHNAVNEVRAASDLQSLPPLHSTHLLSELSSGMGSDAQDGDQITGQSFSSTDVGTELLDKHAEALSRDENIATQPPIQSLYHITHLRRLRLQGFLTSAEDTAPSDNEPNDLISRQMISTHDATILVDYYLQRTDHYLYGLASHYRSLTDIRNTSPLLLTAILTVAALQSPSGQKWYQICYSELRKLIADFTFSHFVALEDLRGLCIACFWLSDISWSISSLAIRRAVELELHRSPTMAIESSRGGQSSIAQDQNARRLFDGMRLWYLLYICDQHLAILYGRPSIIRDDESIKKWSLYHEVCQSSTTDVRILSQMALLQILRSVSETFGQDPKRRVPTLLKPQLDAFNQQIDQWVTHWLNISQYHPIIGSYPSKAIMLHHHFSKLLISSHAFRGLGHGSGPMPAEFKDLAYVAINSAKSVLELTVNDADIVNGFINIPHYYHTMIAFASSFLLKAAKRYQNHISIDATLVFDTVKPVIRLCVNTKCTGYHLVHWIGRGLRVLLANYVKGPHDDDEHTERHRNDLDSTRSPLHMSDIPMNMGLSDIQLDSYNRVWETASAMVYNDLPPTFHGGFNLPAEGSLQGDPRNLSRDPWDPSLSYASIEQLGLGLL